jgi:hypothetical protein
LTPGQTVATRSADGRSGQGAHDVLALSPDFGNANTIQGNGCFRIEHLVYVCGRHTAQARRLVESNHRKKESNQVIVMAKVRSGLILERLIEQALKFPYLGRCQVRILREVNEQRFGCPSKNPIHERSAFRAHVCFAFEGRQKEARAAGILLRFEGFFLRQPGQQGAHRVFRPARGRPQVSGQFRGSLRSVGPEGFHDGPFGIGKGGRAHTAKPFTTNIVKCQLQM